MEQYILYLVLKKIVSDIDAEFKYSFNDMDFNSGRVVGVYIRGASAPKYRTLGSAVYLNNTSRVQFLFQGDLSTDGIVRLLNLASGVRDTLVPICNSSFIVNDRVQFGPSGNVELVDTVEPDKAVGLIISSIKLLGDVTFVGKSEQGLPRYSVNFSVDYSLLRRMLYD